MEDRPCVLTIAGFDPSAGAGILADIKTFEINKVYGQAVSTSLTYQNEKEFVAVDWVSGQDILRQTDILFRTRTFEWIKIGLVQHLDVLEIIIKHLTELRPDCKIIWDPILKASAGFTFHESTDWDQLVRILSRLYLITPNLNEIRILVPGRDDLTAARELSHFCNVMLKGGHSMDKATDLLIEVSGRESFFKGARLPYEKHGTGCVFSAAILTNLAKGYELGDACREAKEYVTDYIRSHESLLGFHYV